MEFTLGDRFKINAVSFMATLLMRIWFFTVRVKIINRPVYNACFRQTGEKMHVVGGSWHRHAIFLFYFFRTLGHRLIMISKSRDGEMTAGIARRFGYTPVRGSSSRGGGNALRVMIETMNAGETRYLCGTAVDGPRGPARTLKRGMVVVAQKTGALFVPMAASGTRLWSFTRAWDRTILPKPFSTMVAIFGTPVHIPADIDEKTFNELCTKIEFTLNRLTDRVDRLCGYRDRPLPVESA